MTDPPVAGSREDPEFRRNRAAHASLAAHAKNGSNQNAVGRAVFMSRFETDEQRSEYFRGLAMKSAKARQPGRRRRPDERLLETLRDAHPRPLSLHEVATSSRTGKATARKTLATLEDDGLVRRVSDGRWVPLPPS